MFYKRYDLSKSLSGDKVIHIARNAAGIVVIRAPSLEQLKKEIDRREEEEKKKLLAAKKAAEKAAKLAKAKKKEKPTELAAATKPEKPSTAEETSSLNLPPRGPNGKFVSRQQETESTPKKKKGFWDRLVG